MAPKDRASVLLEGPILASLTRLAGPIVLANVLQSAYQVIDAFWVGRLGGAAVAAVSVTFPVVFLSIAMGFGLAIAGSTLIAQYFGARDPGMVDKVAGQTLLMVVGVSMTLGALGFVATPFLLRMMGVSADVYDGALGFMRVSFVGLTFNFAFFTYQSIMRGVGEATTPIYIVAGTVALNFVIDPPLIFGWGPIPALGVMGAALATLITQILAAATGIFILARGAHGVKLTWENLRPDWVFIKRVFFLGLPASVEMSARALGAFVMTFLIASFGTLSIAAYGVGWTVLQVVIIPSMGLSMAISALVGQNIGAGNIERAARIGRLGAALGFWTLTGIGVLGFLFAPHVVAFFVPEDQSVIDEGGLFIRIMALSWGCIGAQMAFTAVLRASGNMVMSMVITMVAQWVFQFPLAYVLSKHTPLGSDGLWWSFPVANVLSALVAMGVYAKGDWKKTRLLDEEEKLAEKVAEEIPA